MSFTEPDADINKLTDAARVALIQLRQSLVENGLPFLLYETMRTQERQDWIYASGRTRPGAILTKARVSRHTSGKAFDLILDLDHPRFHSGELRRPRSAWSTGVERHIVSDKDLFQEWLMLGALAESLGLKWGGRWKRKKSDLLGWDPYHFETP